MATKKKTKVPKSFTISRKKWGRESMLNSSGTMCCLGFWAKACKFNDKALLDCAYAPFDHIVLYDDTEESGATSQKYSAYDTIPVEVRVQLAKINDNEDLVGPANLSQAEREAHITGIFDLYNIKVKFVD